MNYLHFILCVIMLSLTLEIYKSEMGIQINFISFLNGIIEKGFFYG